MTKVGVCIAIYNHVSYVNQEERLDMRLVIVIRFEYSGSLFAARVISFVQGKCKIFGDWSGCGWNGNDSDNLIIIH